MKHKSKDKKMSIVTGQVRDHRILRNRFVVVAVAASSVVVIASLIPVAIYHSIAASAFAFFEPESGQLSAATLISKINESQASGGTSIQFKAPTCPSGQTGTPPNCTTTPPPPPPPSGSTAVLVGAGDIAYCSANGDEATAKLIDNIAGTVFTAGDNVYPDGSLSQFQNCYTPTWGRFKSRTKPAPGNHEYRTANASGYWDYFGSAAGTRGKGWYSYNLGDWHVIVLNSNCNQVGGCNAGSAQEQWLRQDLNSNTRACTAAIFHHPIRTLGTHDNDETGVTGLWQALYDKNADLIINGHDHNYQHWKPTRPDGTVDNARGIPQFLVGMGGKDHYGFSRTDARVVAKNSDTWGVMKFTLKSNSFDYQFVPVAGKTYTDTGSYQCH